MDFIRKHQIYRLLLLTQFNETATMVCVKERFAKKERKKEERTKERTE